MKSQNLILRYKLRVQDSSENFVQMYIVKQNI